MQAHVSNGTVDQVIAPPATAFVDGRWLDLHTPSPEALAAAGWVEATPADRPAETATTTHESSWEVVNGKAVQSWTSRAKTPAEIEAETAATNGQTIRQRAADALATNRTYIASTPTNAQVVAHTKALSRQNNGIIRLLLSKLDGTD